MTSPETRWAEAYERKAKRRRKASLAKHRDIFQHFVLQAGSAMDEVSFLDPPEVGLDTSAPGAVAVRFGDEDAAVVLLSPAPTATNQRPRINAFAVGCCPLCLRPALLTPHVRFPDADTRDQEQDSEELRAALGEAFALQRVDRRHDCARPLTGSDDTAPGGQPL